MRCPNCAAEISALRDHCPHCGASTDSAFDKLQQAPGERGRTPEELIRNRRTVGFVAGGILLLVLAMGNFHPFGRHVTFFPGGIKIDTGREARGPVVTNAVDFTRAFAADPSAAERRFGRREIMVSGEFLRIVPDGYGSIDMRLKAANPDFPLGVDLDDQSVDDAKRLQPGQQVTVSCRGISRTGDERWLRDCAVQPAPPAAPPPPAPPTPPAPPRS